MTYLYPLQKTPLISRSPDLADQIRSDLIKDSLRLLLLLLLLRDSMLSTISSTLVLVGGRSRRTASAVCSVAVDRMRVLAGEGARSEGEGEIPVG